MRCVVINQTTKIYFKERKMNFCEKCGTAINEGAVFCGSCGAKLTSSGLVSAERQTVMPSNDSEYDRTALKQYLHDVCFLEAAKAKLNQRWNKENNYVNSLAIPSKMPPKPYDSNFEAIDWGSVGICLLFAVIAGVGGWLLNFVVEFIFETDFMLYLGCVLALAFVIFAICCIIGSIDKNNETRAVYERAKEAESRRLKTETALKKGAVSMREAVFEEYTAASNLLEKAYSVNIIPKPFRNIHAVYYLYDYICTSNQSFTSALLFSDLDDIKRKLDTIIYQQQEIIINQSIEIAQNQSLIEQNQRSLKKLASIEHNTEKAMQYTEIAAINSEACAWIGVANYIKQ